MCRLRWPQRRSQTRSDAALKFPVGCLPGFPRRFYAVGCKRFVEELLLKCLQIRSEAADDAMLVDGHLDRHPPYLHYVDRIVQDRPIQLVPLWKSRQRLGCCSCAIPSTTSLPCRTHSCVFVFQTGTACRQPLYQEAKWIRRTFRPRNCDNDTGVRSAMLGKVKSAWAWPTRGE